MVRFAIIRTLLLGVLWVILTEADWLYLAYGLVVVPLAVWMSLRWAPPPDPSHAPSTLDLPRRLGAGVSVVGWILVQTMRGGIDVARRALAVPVRVEPVLMVVPVHLTGGPAVFALAVFGLMPGTIVTEVREGEAVVHTLSAELDAAGTWAELEHRIAAVLGSRS